MNSTIFFKESPLRNGIGYIDRIKFVVKSSLLIWISFIGQFVQPVGGWDNGVGGIIILTSYEHHFIRVYKNLVQQKINNISIPLRKIFFMKICIFLQCF